MVLRYLISEIQGYRKYAAAPHLIFRLKEPRSLLLVLFVLLILTVPGVLLVLTVLILIILIILILLVLIVLHNCDLL